MTRRYWGARHQTQRNETKRNYSARVLLLLIWTPSGSAASDENVVPPWETLRCKQLYGHSPFGPSSPIISKVCFDNSGIRSALTVPSEDIAQPLEAWPPTDRGTVEEFFAALRKAHTKKITEHPDVKEKEEYEQEMQEHATKHQQQQQDPPRSEEPPEKKLELDFCALGRKKKCEKQRERERKAKDSSSQRVLSGHNSKTMKRAVALGLKTTKGQNDPDSLPLLAPSARCLSWGKRKPPQKSQKDALRAWEASGGYAWQEITSGALREEGPWRAATSKLFRWVYVVLDVERRAVYVSNLKVGSTTLSRLMLSGGLGPEFPKGLENKKKKKNGAQGAKVSGGRDGEGGGGVGGGNGGGGRRVRKGRKRDAVNAGKKELWLKRFANTEKEERRELEDNEEERHTGVAEHEEEEEEEEEEEDGKRSVVLKSCFGIKAPEGKNVLSRIAAEVCGFGAGGGTNASSSIDNDNGNDNDDGSLCKVTCDGQAAPPFKRSATLKTTDLPDELLDSFLVFGFTRDPFTRVVASCEWVRG